MLSLDRVIEREVELSRVNTYHTRNKDAEYGDSWCSKSAASCAWDSFYSIQEELKKGALVRQPQTQLFRWLQCSVLLSAHTIPSDWLISKGSKEKDFHQCLINQMGKIVSVLIKKNLIHYDSNRKILSFHRLQQHLYRMVVSPENKQEILENALELLHDIAQNLNCENFSDRLPMHNWASHAQAILSQNLKPCLRNADLLYKLGEWMRTIGKCQEGLIFHKRALTIRRKILDNNHIDIVRSLVSIAFGLIALGKNQEAIKYAKKALLMKNELEHRNSQERAKAYRSWGFVVWLK